MSTTARPAHRIWLFAVAALVIAFLLLPVVLAVPMSFSSSRYLDFPPPSWSLRWYERLFGSAEWMDALIVSVKLAAATTAIGTPLGVAAAYACHVGDPRLFRRIGSLVLMPLLVPHIIMAVGLYYIYARVGLIGTFAGLLFAHVMLTVPFVFVATTAGLRGYDMSQELAARALGCNRLHAFLVVTLPQIRVSVLSGALLGFVSSLDETIIALFIAAGRNQTIPKVVFGSLRDEIDPTVAAVSSLLIGASLVAAAIALVPTLRRARTG